MRANKLGLVLATGLAAAGAVQAAEVTQSGAGDIERALTRYLPADLVSAGLVTVRAATSFYELRLDLAPLAARTDPRRFSVMGLKPFVYYVRPLDDGLYSVEANDKLDIRATTTIPERTSFTYLIDTIKMTGVYDPAIFYFRSADFSLNGAHITSQTDKQSVDARIGTMTMALAAQKSATDAIDITSRGLIETFNETIVDKQTGRVAIDVDSVDIDVTMDGARYKALQDIVLFVLDRIDRDQLTADEAAALKSMLRAVLPVFDDLKETITANNVTVATDKGVFAARRVGYEIGMNGVAHSTRVSFGLSVDEPRPPAGLVPDAFREALPTTARFRGAMTDLDLAGAVAYLIDNADFTARQPLTEAQNRELGRIVLPGGAMTFDFETVEAKSAIYDVSMTGRMTVYPEETPRQTADVTIVARAFDKTVAFLQKNASAVPQFGQAAFVLLMVKGFGIDQGDGSLRWDVSVDEAGKVLMNGQPLPFQP
ncbi:hypothetical protein LXM94_12190 [Rhizobium sp. TRM95111]|uniref:hypothetical protein n=1 Tax=Rhizobium alarense TaxID=2846851 RepID=UPI001F472C20|nr:hypothetical protein [Rhizobium alarense]MCF3640726.1 hypothetical protein [Rhizobium alarense]